MTYDISAIKNLPIAERLKIIDELWKTIADGATLDNEIDSEEEQILQDRLKKYESGEMKFYPWQDVKEKLLQRFRNK